MVLILMSCCSKLTFLIEISQRGCEFCPGVGTKGRLHEKKVALVKGLMWNVDCRYIDTFEKYLYRYRYWYGEVENIDIDIDIDRAILKNIDIDIDKAIPKISISISISIWWFWKISISISIRQFCKILISIKYRIDSNLAYRTGLQWRVHFIKTLCKTFLLPLPRYCCIQYFRSWKNKHQHQQKLIIHQGFNGELWKCQKIAPLCTDCPPHYSVFCHSEIPRCWEILLLLLVQHAEISPLRLNGIVQAVQAMIGQPNLSKVFVKSKIFNGSL